MPAPVPAARRNGVVEAAAPDQLGERAVALGGALARPRQPVRRPGAAVVPEAARPARHVRRGQQPDRGVGALDGIAQQRADHAGEARERLRQPAGAHPSRVHGEDPDRIGAPALRELLGDDHLEALGVRVEPRAVELLALELEVVWSQPRRVHAARRDEDDTGRRRRAQLGREQPGQQQRPEHVRRDGELVSLPSVAPLAYEHAGVVKHPAQIGPAGLERGRERADRVEVREVALPGLEAGATRTEAPAHARRRGLEPVAIPRDHVHARATGSEARAGGLADTRAGSGDDHVGAGDRRRARRLAPGAGAQAVAGRPEAGHDGEVERAVGDRAEGGKPRCPACCHVSVKCLSRLTGRR